jgi:hypothetical protein
VKLSERKSVQRKNVTIILVEPLAETREPGGIAQFARRQIAQAKSNGIGRTRANPLANRQSIFFERIERLLPILAPMNVRAVGEMQSVIELHPRSLAEKSSRLESK